MAVMSKSSNKWAFSLRVLLVSTGVLSMAIILKLSIPVVLEFMISVVPVFWTSFLSWLTPPYLYVIINGIIITIAASSRFHHKNDGHPQAEPLVAVNKIITPNQQSDFVMSSGYDDTVMMMSNSIEVRSEFQDMISYENHEVTMKNQVDQVRAEFGGIVVGYRHNGNTEKNLADQVGTEYGEMFGYDHHEVVMKNLEEFEDLKPKFYEHKQEEILIPERKINRVDNFSQDENENSFMISRSSWTPNRTDIEFQTDTMFSNEKPPASSRFNHKKSVKASPEGGKTLGVTKPKRHDTLEVTWKTITDGRSMPLTRHLKKSETFTERHNNQSSLSPSPVSSGKLKKEPSLSQDDLNRRVEAFISKFNEDMRLQRQESLNQYKEMVNLRAH
ncbi:hypothetical protein MKW98_025814 [Papaver atlanticum]|uniref:DUF4408 domain-containing protein n=1 Tax=Papaver atlanticum TaxID=357466 RepID=A0AAD4RV47_9MAGN|nr:hypothetical protein MKW98_025814 [Papaver atlanticum]